MVATFLDRRGPGLAAAVGLVFGLGAPAAGLAQAITVLPVNIQMAPGQLAATLTIVNEGDVDTSVQVRAFAWSQQPGGDRLDPSALILASPPLATIKPHARQVVRLILRQAPTSREESYRLILDQIPPPGAPGTVRLALRLSIPVFAEPPVRVVPALSFALDPASGAAALIVRNDGKRHARINDLAIVQADGKAIKLSTGTSPYMLAGSRRILTVAGSTIIQLKGTLRVRGTTDAGGFDQLLAPRAAP